MHSLHRVLGGVALALLLSLAQAGCVTIELLGRREPLVETTVYGETGPKIVLIEIDGVITSQEESVSPFGALQESTVARVREQLKRAAREPELCALLLRIDSPGGTATASEILHDELERFQAQHPVPVVAQLMGTATSGGYYVAMAADEVVAYVTTVTGSIGVIFVDVEISGLMDKLGIGNQTLKAGRHKDAGSPLRPLAPDERAYMNAILTDLHERFREVVAAGRPGLSRAQVDELSDGRIFSARQALALGLIDRIATLDDTVAAIQRKTGHSETRVVRYHRPREWRRTLYDEAPAPAPTLNLDLGSFLGPLRRPGFLYLWWP